MHLKPFKTLNHPKLHTLHPPIHSNQSLTLGSSLVQCSFKGEGPLHFHLLLGLGEVCRILWPQAFGISALLVFRNWLYPKLVHLFAYAEDMCQHPCCHPSAPIILNGFQAGPWRRFADVIDRHLVTSIAHLITGRALQRMFGTRDQDDITEALRNLQPLPS